MSTGKVAVYVKCPYYRREVRKERKIMCEGLTDGTDLYQRFPSLEAMQAHKKAFCNRQSYGSCPIAKALNGKYGYE